MVYFSRAIHGDTMVKNAPVNADMGLISASGRSPGGGNGNPRQYSCLGNPMDGGAWQVTFMGSKESELSDWAYIFFSERTESFGRFKYLSVKGSVWVGGSCFSHLSPPKAPRVEAQALNSKVFRDDWAGIPQPQTGEASSGGQGRNSVGDTEVFTQVSPLHWALPPERGPASRVRAMGCFLLPSKGLRYFLSKMEKALTTKWSRKGAVLGQWWAPCWDIPTMKLRRGELKPPGG